MNTEASSITAEQASAIEELKIEYEDLGHSEEEFFDTVNSHLPMEGDVPEVESLDDLKKLSEKDAFVLIESLKDEINDEEEEYNDDSDEDDEDDFGQYDEEEEEDPKEDDD